MHANMIAKLSSVLGCAALAAAGPVLLPRTVTALDEGATAEAQQRDNTATRAFSNVQIQTSDGRCLFVDKLSGDFRENLTPIQVATCGSTDGQGWDVITKGKHIDIANSALIVSTLTEACFNFDPRRAAGNQVLLFSCGGRADGGGQVTTSQTFSFNGTAGPLPLEPGNAAGSCLTVKGNVIDIANCNAADPNQSFTFGGAAAAAAASSATTTAAAAAETSASSAAAVSTTQEVSQTAAEAAGATSSPPSQDSAPSQCGGVRTVFVTASAEGAQATQTSAAAVASSDPGVALGAAEPDTSSASEAASTTDNAATTTADAAATATSTADAVAAATSSAASQSTAASSSASAPDVATTGQATAISNPTTPVPVSRGGTLNPSAAAEANTRDGTATRAFSSVSIRAPNGQCLFVDPTAGDFRENLIPVSLVDCAGTPNEKWDVVTAGKHNDATGAALIVSSLMQGCISFDGRRSAGDTVNVFSCGGRADGTGQTNSDQLMPFIGALSFAFAPSGENNKTCILPGNGRLDSGPCPTDGSQLFSIFP